MHQSLNYITTIMFRMYLVFNFSAIKFSPSKILVGVLKMFYSKLAEMVSNKKQR